MTDVLGFAAYLLLPLIGIGAWRIDSVRRMPLAARIAVAFAAGALITATVMALMSLVGLEWNRTKLFVILGVIAAVSARGVRGADGRGTGVWWPVLIFVILSAYGIATARESAGDLHFFWGPKAVRFYRAGGIDADYLRTPDYQPAHPDYPPLLPLLFAWSHTLSAATFSWWAAVMATLLFLLGTIVLVPDKYGALLVAATLSYTFAVGFAAGGADPPLIFFEALALIALVFYDDDLLAAIGLAGAAWTKIEGATFVIAVVIAFLLVRRAWKRALVIAAPAAILLGSWVLFVKYAKLLELYRGAAMTIYWNALPGTLKTMAQTATYELYGLPWLVPIAIIVLAKNRRDAALPLIVAVLTLGVAVFFYIHLPDPTWWILASAHRVYLTPLLALLIAAIRVGRDDVAGERRHVP